mgnify:CR=1 FL=1
MASDNHGAGGVGKFGGLFFGPRTNKTPVSSDGGLDVLGGAGRNRTDDLYNAIVALSQLSYGPKTVFAVAGVGTSLVRTAGT